MSKAWLIAPCTPARTRLGSLSLILDDHSRQTERLDLLQAFPAHTPCGLSPYYHERCTSSRFRSWKGMQRVLQVCLSMSGTLGCKLSVNFLIQLIIYVEIRARGVEE